MSAYVTPPPEPSDEPARPWDHSAFAEDSYHAHRPVADPQEFLRSLEIEGYAVWPCVLPPPLLHRLQQQISTYATNPRDYSSRQRGVALAGPVPFIDRTLQTHGKSNALAELIGHPETVTKLAQIFGGGSPPVFVSFAYDISCVGTPGISLHTDMQPYGSTLFGGSLFSSPQLVRVLYYLDDLTLDVSPFRCIPRSHLSMHADANPYTRYAEHPDQVIVTVPAGSAVFLNARIFHGTMPNLGAYDRRMLAVAYRPSWAGPVPTETLPQWDPAEVAALPSCAQPFFNDPNLREGFQYDAPNKPHNMRSDAIGLRVARYGSSKL